MEAFKYGCVVSGHHFCKRPLLMRQLSAYVAVGQNLVIQGERRIGKTSLVQATLAAMKGWKAVTVDFMGVKSTTDVCNRLADAMSRFDADDTLYRRALTLLSHLRPIGQIDPLTGQPTITVDARASGRAESVTVAIDALARHVKGRKVCIVFDEFQDILDLSDGDQVLALLRGRIQYLSDIPFVFLGSARNAMLSIFLSPKSPFYKSAITFDVGEIPEGDFYRFAVSRFATGKRTLPRESFVRILDVTGRTTGDVQELCDAIWQTTSPGDEIDAASIERGIRLVFAREAGAYATFIKPLTAIQMNVLRALAELGGNHVLSAEFLERANVRVPMTIKRSLTALEKAELVYCLGKEWKFVSPFFKAWVRCH